MIVVAMRCYCLQVSFLWLFPFYACAAVFWAKKAGYTFLCYFESEHQMTENAGPE